MSRGKGKGKKKQRKRGLENRGEARHRGRRGEEWQKQREREKAKEVEGGSTLISRPRESLARDSKKTRWILIGLFCTTSVHVRIHVCVYVCACASTVERKRCKGAHRGAEKTGCESEEASPGPSWWLFKKRWLSSMRWREIASKRKSAERKRVKERQEWGGVIPN